MSLLEPWYLLGLLGLFLPWMLHRFSHHEPPEQAFPTTRFLEATTPPATSKRKLRYWLLLALRVLFLALLCLLFAQPWLRSLSDSADSESVRLIVVDTSFSMRAEERWQATQEALGSVLSELDEGEAAQLFTYSGQLTALTDITQDAPLVKSALTQVSPGFESADFGELMRRLDKVAGDIDKSVSATFITDAQRTNLPAKMNTLLASKLSRFSVVSVQGDSPVNYALQAEAITADTVNARVSVTIYASESAAANDANADVMKRVQLSMNGRELGVQEMAIGPGESKVIHFDSVNLPSDISADMQVNFVQNDFFPDDDQVSIPVRGLNTIDVVLTSVGGDIDEQARVFMSTALETEDDVRVETRELGTALAPSVRHAMVFVDQLESIPDSVNEFVAKGGNVLVLPRTLSPSSGSSFLDDPMSVTTIDLPHALALGDIDWFASRFYHSTDMSLRDNDRVLLGLDSSQPLLVERVLNGSSNQPGRMLILNDALDGFNSDLPLQPAFVQLMQHVVQYFNASNALPTKLRIGKDLFLPASTQILTPAGDAMLALDQLGDANYVRIEEPGVYTVLGTNSSDKVNVVLNPAESNLSGMGRDELDAWESRHDANTQSGIEQSNSDSANDENATGLARNSISETQKNTLWRLLLPLALIFLLVECLLANRLLWVRRDGL